VSCCAWPSSSGFRRRPYLLFPVVGGTVVGGGFVQTYADCMQRLYDEEQRVFFAEMRRVIPKEPRDNAKFGGGVAAPQPGKRDSISTRPSLLLLLLLRPSRTTPLFPITRRHEGPEEGQENGEGAAAGPPRLDPGHRARADLQRGNVCLSALPGIPLFRVRVVLGGGCARACVRARSTDAVVGGLGVSIFGPDRIRRSRHH
jgi:hypothetical protein